jgi:CRP-like cAMP-binding protein
VSPPEEEATEPLAKAWRLPLPSNFTPYASSISGRDDQALPSLTEAELARIERFGKRRRYRRGERLFAAGERAPGMFVVLSGTRKMS